MVAFRVVFVTFLETSNEAIDEAYTDPLDNIQCTEKTRYNEAEVPKKKNSL